MISIQCDNCERIFEVPDTEAGSKKPCPSCGDVNRVPAAPSEPAVAAAPAVISEGSAGARDGAEQEITVIRPAMFRAHPFRYLILVLIFGGGIGLLIWGWMIEESWRWWPIA